jgi:hypothetical protein
MSSITSSRRFPLLSTRAALSSASGPASPSTREARLSGASASASNRAHASAPGSPGIAAVRSTVKPRRAPSRATAAASSVRPEPGHVNRLCADNVLTAAQADDWWHTLEQQAADGHFLAGAVIFVVAATRPDGRTG